MKKNKFYISTPAYYPSAHLHLGHTYCTVLCDALARYNRLVGREVYYLTGSDEHGMKIEKNAEKANLSPKQFVDGIAQTFKDLWEKLHINYDRMIRTTDEDHIHAVEEIFSRFLKQGDIYLGEYEGWYCRECEAFWTDTQVGEEHLCPDCNRPVSKAKEEAYFFKTSKYIDRLIKFYDENPSFLVPEHRKNEMFNTFIKPGLGDLCVSRTSFDWGIKVKENPRHVIYVWLDALVNYISALGYLDKDDSLLKKFWLAEDSYKVHVLGNDITRFHAIYWPMFLMALDLPLPDKECVHGLLMTKDGKMSKSKGNVINPVPLIELYGVDAVRYYLAREINFGTDGQFTPEQFVERINMDLANNLGNLLNRTVSMVNKYYGGVIPSFTTNINNPFDKELDDAINECLRTYEYHFETLHVTDAIAEVLKMTGRANKYIDETMPWVLAKEEDKTKLDACISHLCRALYVAGVLLKPILVLKADLLLDQLGVNNREYKDLTNEHLLDGLKVDKKDQLFPRLDINVEVNKIVELIKNGSSK